MKRLAIAAGVAAMAAALASTATAASPSACGLVTATEYQRVLHVPVKLTPSPGGEVCKVSIGGRASLLPNVFPFNPQVFADALALKRQRGGRVTRVAALGPRGYFVQGGDPTWSKTTLAVRHGFIVSVQAGAAQTRTQVIALTKLALAHL